MGGSDNAISQTICSILRTYERSVSLAKIGQILFQPTSNIILEFPEGPDVFSGPSFAFIQELLRRDRRIDILLRSGFLSLDKSTRPGFNEEQLGRIRQGFKRAMHTVDQLADIGIQIAFEGRGGSNARRVKNTRRARYLKIRTAQSRHLGTAPTVELAFLYEFLVSAGAGYMRYKDHPEAIPPQSIVELNERTVAFREAILRRGSGVLFAFVRGTGSVSKYAESAVTVAQEERTYTYPPIQLHSEGEPAPILLHSSTRVPSRGFGPHVAAGHSRLTPVLSLGTLWAAGEPGVEKSLGQTLVSILRERLLGHSGEHTGEVGGGTMDAPEQKLDTAIKRLLVHSVLGRA